MQLTIAQLEVDEFVQLPTAQVTNATFKQKIPGLLALTTFTNHVEIMNRCRDRRGTYFLYALCILSKVKNRRIAEMYCQSNLFFVDGERKNTVTEDVCRISE